MPLSTGGFFFLNIDRGKIKCLPRKMLKKRAFGQFYSLCIRVMANGKYMFNYVKKLLN